MARIGCGICRKELGKYQYRNIGLCSKCRRDTAKKLGKEVRHTTLSDVKGGDWYSNLAVSNA